MSSTTSNNKRIAKNTLLLYFRMFLTMCISLYTSRVILQVLGVEDFGIYNVVGGVVSLFSFITSSMSSAVSRFLSYELGKDCISRLTDTFRTSFTLHFLIAVFVCVLAELFGLWFIYSKLVIPFDRLTIALYVFHISVLTTFVSILIVPFTALVFSNEKMGAYAFAEITGVALKLILVISLKFASVDKLLLYSVYILMIQLFLLFFYVLYDKRHFAECKIGFLLNRNIAIPIMSFSGWDLYGNASVVARTQGVNIMLNVFFGPVLNAASGIATQVQGAVSAFSNNVLVAIRPQIVKSYAKKNINYTIYLMSIGLKFTSILLLMIISPLIVEMRYVLDLWLGYYPSYTIVFCQLTLLFVFFANISSVVMSVVHATGYVKKSSILNGTLYLLVIPLGYLAFHYGSSPIIPFVLNAFFVVVGFTLNMIYLSQYIKIFDWKLFYKKNIIPVLLLGGFVTVFIIALRQMLESSFIRVVILSLSSIVLYGCGTYFFLMTIEMRTFVKNKIKFIRNRR